MSRTAHVPLIPHTLPTDQFSHCAFTTKARRLPELLAKTKLFDRIITYGVRGYPVEDASHVALMPKRDWEGHFAAGHKDPTQLVGNQAASDHPGYRHFNDALTLAWQKHVKDGDVVCFPFGHAHQPAMSGYAGRRVLSVETGIGYPAPFLPFRIYESEAWLHYVGGRTRCEGHDYHFVAPASYSVRDGWHTPTMAEMTQRRDLDVVYMGRLQDDKGMRILHEVARAMPDVQFWIYGQGDPAPYLRENVNYGGVLHGAERRAVWLRARAGLFMSRYIEPFSQAHAEALLCGTPVVGSVFGIFPESERTMWETPHAVMPARTLADIVAALRYQLTATPTRRAQIADIAQKQYGLARVAQRYRAILSSMLDVLDGDGWYTDYAHLHTS